MLLSHIGVSLPFPPLPLSLKVSLKKGYICNFPHIVKCFCLMWGQVSLQQIFTEYLPRKSVGNREMTRWCHRVICFIIGLKNLKCITVLTK